MFWVSVKREKLKSINANTKECSIGRMRRGNGDFEGEIRGVEIEVWKLR